MSKKQKINKVENSLKGLYFETNKEGTELKFPPVAEYAVKKPSEKTNKCGSKIKLTEEGNTKYAWYYLKNKSNKYMNITFEKKWKYKGSTKTKTVRIRMYPKEKREVFSFPRNQKPKCKILACEIE